MLRNKFCLNSYGVKPLQSVNSRIMTVRLIYISLHVHGKLLFYSTFKTIIYLLIQALEVFKPKFHKDQFYHFNYLLTKQSTYSIGYRPKESLQEVSQREEVWNRYFRKCTMSNYCCYFQCYTNMTYWFLAFTKWNFDYRFGNFNS